MKAIELLASIITSKKNTITKLSKSYNYQSDEFGTMSERFYNVYEIFISQKQKSFLLSLLVKEDAKINNNRFKTFCIFSGYRLELTQQHNGSYLIEFDDLNDKNLSELIPKY